MVEFGRMMGIAHSAISRYESGKIAPSRAVLVLLWGLAEGDYEKRVIAHALGEEPKTLEASVARFNRDVLQLAAEFDQELLRVRTSPETRRRFADLALKILAEPEMPIETVNLLSLWVKYRTNPAARAEFKDALTRLEIRLDLLESTDAPHAKSGRRRVMIRCPETGKPVFTGVELTPAEFESTGITGMEVFCPHCKSGHLWDKSDAFLEAV
jgi:transcriptional regulator with XRE-family HTH domain